MDEEMIRDPIPEFETLEEIAEFWNTHSTAEYSDLTREANFEVELRERGKHPSVLLLPELNKTLETLAKARGVSVETLVNVWLTEKVLEVQEPDM